MIKIFQTGDNHIGLKYSGHEKSKELAKIRTDAFINMVEKANDERCDIFAITGDLFENTYGISKKDVASLVDILSEFCGTVAIIPGNHDYYDKDAKVWQYFEAAMRDKQNILLMNEYRPYEIDVRDEAVTIYPAFCSSLHSDMGENNLAWIKSCEFKTDAAYKIGMAHGAVEGETIDSEGKYFLMTRDELSDIPVDLWLIGHTHVPFPNNITENDTLTAERIFNAGTHVQTDVSCNTEGVCFIIEIDKEKGISAKKYISGPIGFKRLTISFSSGGMADTLENALKNISDNTVVDLVCSGAVHADEYEARARIFEKALKRFTEGRYDDYKVSKLITKDTIDAEFLQTSFAAGFLADLLDDPKEAQMAYEMINSIREEI